MKRPSKRKVSLDEISDHEWDFRGVSLLQLEDAIFYEYARENRDLRALFDRWHRKNVTVEGRGRRTVQEILEQADSGGDVDVDEVNAYVKTVPDASQNHHLERLLWICPLFPRSFLKTGDLRKGAQDFWESQECSFSFLKRRKKVTTKTRKDLASRHVFIEVVRMDMKAGAESIERAAVLAVRRYYAGWARHMQERETSASGALGGNRKERYSWLKDLAAFRLNRAANFKDAQDYISKRTRLPITSEHHLLPFYKAASSWTEACGKAARRIQDKWPFDLQGL